MLWGSYNNNVFAFTLLPGSCVILPRFGGFFFYLYQAAWDFYFFLFFVFLFWALLFVSIFVREKIFRSRPSHKKISVFSKSVTEGTHKDSCSGKTKFKTWKENSKKEKKDTE